MALSILVCFALASGLSAASPSQAKPDFSGRWEVVSPAERAGETMEITQTATVVTEAHGDEHSVGYNLDGTQRRNVVGVHHDQQVVILTESAWKGDTLVVTTKATYPAGNTRESRQLWTLTDGALTIDFTDRRNTPAEKTTRLVYKKRP